MWLENHRLLIENFINDRKRDAAYYNELVDTTREEAWLEGHRQGNQFGQDYITKTQVNRIELLNKCIDELVCQ